MSSLGKLGQLERRGSAAINLRQRDWGRETNYIRTQPCWSLKMLSLGEYGY